MEANKIKGESKSIVLDNGAELTYCEYGKENKEVLIAGAFYFHTLMPVIEGLAKRYHVYGVVMRFDGITDELNPDGTTHWGRQWGKDLYDFSQKHTAVRTLILFVCVGKMLSYISECRRTENCICKCMKCHICVTMSQKSLFIRYFNTANYTISALYKLMNVISLSYSHSVIPRFLSILSPIIISSGVVSFILS